MGMLIDGQWQNDEVRRTAQNGEFVRTASTFRSSIGEENFAVESGRYHLFVNPGCPWASRAMLYRSVKGLGQHLGLSVTQAAMGPEGWTFGAEGEDILGARHIHDVYTRADPNFTGRTTVPVLWDLQQSTVVNNESAEIIRMLDSQFDDLAGVNTTRFYTSENQDEIDALNERIYDDVNNGVYRCGFAQSQQAYDDAFDRLFSCLDELDERLSSRRYLCGPTVTEADWRLFATLVRFDMAYHGQFRCNRNQLVEFENLWPYTRDLYQYPGVAESVDFAAIKGIYYGSRAPGILPKGPAIDFEEPHGRGDN